MAQQRNGKIEQALASYERAYKGNEKDSTIAAEYASLLVGTGQGARALAVLSPETGVLRFDDRNELIVSAWLDLEAMHGDRAKALDARKRLFERKPDDATNARQYLSLLVEDKKFDEADEVLSAMEAAGGFTPLDIIGGRARIRAARGELEEARAMLLDHVNSTPKAERTEQMYLLIGAFEREHGSPEGALLAFEAGREFQDPVVRGLDRASGDLHFSMGDRDSVALASARNSAQASEEAAAAAAPTIAELEASAREHYTKAEAYYAAIAKADPEAIPVKKRHAETLIRLERFDEALAVLESVDEPDDLQVLMLKETLASRKGDIRGARAALDRAVEKYPNNPMPFYRRALLNRRDPALTQDVMKDLDQALRLNPGMIDAWKLRVQVIVNQDRGEDDAITDRRRDQAIAELGRAVQANPNNDDLILFYLDTLHRSGRRDEAKKIAVDIALARETDTNWLRRAAIWSYDLEDFQQAEALYKKIYDIAPGPGPAMDLLNSYLRREDPPPTRAEVNRILPLIVQAESELTPGGKMLIARAREFLEERAEAEKWTVSAYESAKAHPVDSRLWFENVVLRFGKDREKAFEYILKKKEYQPLPPVIRLLVLRREVTNGRPLESALEALHAMEPECSSDPYAKMELLRLRNMFHYSLGMYAESAEDCREGLQLLPRDLEFNNNLAYILAKHLDDPQGALKPAELAAELAPRDPAVLDTLGWVYFRLERYRDADRVFAQSIQTSTTPDDFVPTYLHQAQSKNKIGDKAEATRFIRLAKENLEQASQTIKDVYTEEIDALFNELTGGQ
jgi:tetratricopeptide (TPR) repeat protein